MSSRNERRHLAFISVRTVQKYLGAWPTARDARIAYDRAVLHFELDHRRLRVPHLSRPLGPATPKELQRLGRLRRNPYWKWSRYTGVTYKPSEDVWSAHVGRGAVAWELGRFKTEKEAARAHDEVALYLHGKRAKLNFPEAVIRPRSPQEACATHRESRRRQRSGREYSGIYREHGLKTRPWIARFMFKTKTYYCGNWSTARQAAIARDRALLHFRAGRSLLSFPEQARALRPASPKALRAEARASTRDQPAAPSVRRERSTRSRDSR